MGDDIAPLFARVLLVCDRLNLIGRDLFAIDGVKLPGNASKAKSGTRTELKERADKMRAAGERIIARHREQDAAKAGDGLSEREIRSIERLQKQARQVDEWLSANPKDRKGTSGGVRKSNLTDNDSAKMATGSHCVCPAGNRLYRNGGDCTINGQRAMKFSGAQRDCLACTLRAQCLRKPDTTKVRQVAFFRGRRDATETAVDRMKARIDSDIGKQMIAARFATVEPVFGNLRANKQLTRFTLRGQKKVDGQWKLMCMLHNIEKLAHHGYAQ